MNCSEKTYPKKVQLKSTKWSLLTWVAYGVVIISIFLFFLLNKGYQSKESGICSSTSRVSGTFYTENDLPNSMQEDFIWDDTHFVIPPKERSGFFIATKILSTERQSLKSCESMRNCSSDSDCPKDQNLEAYSARFTGKCINSAFSKETNIEQVCEVYGWCPLHENDPNFKLNYLGAGVENFTVFIKNYVHFPENHHKVSNLIENLSLDYLKSCRHHPQHDKYCPVFRIGDMVQWASKEKQLNANSSIWTTGGVISVHIDWDCNLDKWFYDCVPTYHFHRIDDIYEDIYGAEDMVTRGFTFRYSDKYFYENKEHRTLKKVYGIQFILKMRATAGKFQFYSVVQNLGSAYGLMKILILLEGFVLLCCLKKYTNYEFESIEFKDEN